MVMGNNPWGGNDNPQNKNDKNIDDIVKKIFNNLNLVQGKDFNFYVKIIPIIFLVLVIIWLLTGFYIINPDESGVELVFGKYNNTTSPGLNYNFPSPIGKTFKLSTATVYKEEIGMKVGMNRSNHVGSGIMLTGDENIVNVSFEVQWRINDPYKYLFNLRDDFNNNTIKSASESAMRESIGQNSINFIMIGEGRSKVSIDTYELLQKILDSYSTGVDILSVQLIKVDPPEKVIDSFRDVQSAKADKEKEVNQAQSYYNDKIPRSRAIANKRIKNAEAYKQEIINNAEGEVSKFKAIHEQYKNGENITKIRLYLETMESILQNLDKIIIEKDSAMVSYLPMHDLLKRKEHEK